MPAPWQPLSSPRARVRALLSLRRALTLPEPSPRSATDWHDICAVAIELWVAPALWLAIRDTADALAPDVLELLQDHHRANTIRNLRFKEQLREAVQTLNLAGVTPLLFKGSVQLVDGTAAGTGARGMSDLDLAVPAPAMAAAVEALKRIGYAPVAQNQFAHPHVVVMERHRTPGPIEVHVELGFPPISSVLPFTRVWAASAAIAVGGGRARTPSPSHQVLHNILHSAVQDLHHVVAGMPLRQLLTLARLARVHGAAVDWAAVSAELETRGHARALADHLWLAHRFAGLELPKGHRGGPSQRLHEARVLATFGLGWPARLQQNLRIAFAPDYLDKLYGHGGRPAALARARARHAVHVTRRDGTHVVREAFARRT
ncbi:MAG TPA: nucleotidyltransferase family protein [Solirubrobacteraceae bacterium]